ncbi:MAG: response regulator transcription factor [Pusillimonas sp.]|nr:response regulator transcription factor [Pusillimonas sp.]
MNETQLKILIVEDHKALAENLFEFFGQNPRYLLDFAPDGLTALHLIATHRYNIIVLDVMLPGVSGFEICKRIRLDLKQSTPVIIMTAKDMLEDKETGFGVGADDYLVKPFNLRELQLRIEALARRHETGNAGLIQLPGLLYNTQTHSVSVKGHKELELTGTMAKLFEQLVCASPNLVTYEKIADTVWGDREVDRHTIRTHAYALRKLLQQQFGKPLIKTRHGLGYHLIAPDEFE